MKVLQIGGTFSFFSGPPARPLAAFLFVRHKSTLLYKHKPSAGRVGLQDNVQNAKAVLQHFYQFIMISSRMQNQPFVDSTMSIYL